MESILQGETKFGDFYATLILIPLGIGLVLITAYYITKFISINYSLDGAAMATVFSASANLVFVLMILIQVRKQTKAINLQSESIKAQKQAIEKQEENVEAQKASYQPLLEGKGKISKDGKKLKLKLSNKGRGPAKNIRMVVLIKNPENALIGTFYLGNLPSGEAFVPQVTSEPNEYIEFMIEDCLNYVDGDEINTEAYDSLDDLDKNNYVLNPFIVYENILEEEMELFKPNLRVPGEALSSEPGIMPTTLISAEKTMKELPPEKEWLTHPIHTFTREFDDDGDLYGASETT